MKFTWYLSLWDAFYSVPRDASIHDERSLIAVKFSPLLYKVCSPASFSQLRVVDKLMTSRMSPKTASFSQSRFHNERGISTRHQNLNIVMAALSQAFDSRYQQPASQIRNLTFDLPRTVPTSEYTDASKLYVQLRLSSPIPYPSMVALQVRQEQLPYGQVAWCPVISVLFINALLAVVHNWNPEVTLLLLLQSLLLRKVRHHQAEYGLRRPIENDAGRSKTFSTSVPNFQAFENLPNTAFCDGTTQIFPQQNTLSMYFIFFYPEPLQLALKSGSLGVTNEAWKESQLCRLHPKRTSHQPQWNTHFGNGLSAP